MLEATLLESFMQSIQGLEKLQVINCEFNNLVSSKVQLQSYITHYLYHKRFKEVSIALSNGRIARERLCYIRSMLVEQWKKKDFPREFYIDSVIIKQEQK